MLQGTEETVKYNPAQVESEIPDDLKESPPLETVGMLDKRFDELLTEIGFMHESRYKDFQNTEARRDRLPAIQTTTFYERYKQIRQDRINMVSKVELPIVKETSSSDIKREIESVWNLSDSLNGPNLLEKMVEFFRDKSFQGLEESALLLSRWQRFCKFTTPILKFNRFSGKTSVDIAKNLPPFQLYFEYLSSEFTDSVHRLERLSDSLYEHEKMTKARQAAEEQERAEAERNGIFNKRKVQIANVGILATEALKAQKAVHKTTRERADFEAKAELERHRMAEDEIEVPPDMEDPGFTTSDLAIYMRHILKASKGAKFLEMFRRRANVMLQSDRLQLLREYTLITTLKPGTQLLETLDDYNGVNLFMEVMPSKAPKVEDFITEFEILCAHFKIETSVMQEDGRPFSYEIDGRFTCRFFEQILQTTFPPYDLASNDLSKTRQTQMNVPSNGLNEKANSTLPEDNPIIAHASAILANSGIPCKFCIDLDLLIYWNQVPTSPKLKFSDWLRTPVISPKLDDWQEKQQDILRQYKELDFELLCEMDLIRCNDVDIVLHRLKENARKMWEIGAKKPNSKPLSAKSTVLSKPGTRAIQETEMSAINDNSRLPKSFDLGMLVPDGRDRLSDHRVLDGKKQVYGNILKVNEELRDASHDSSSPKRITTVIEVLKWQQPFRPVNEKLVNMLKRQASKFEFDENIKGEGNPNNYGKLNSEQISEDQRLFVNDSVTVKDHRGIEIIYDSYPDSALNDLKLLESEILRIATIYINNGSQGKTSTDASFFDDLILTRDKKSEIKDFTFLNPLVDRSQLLLEIFDSEVVNGFLEIYEHITSFSDIKTCCQMIVNIIHSRPSFDFASPYFTRSYVLSAKKLILQSNLMLQMMKDIIESSRLWSQRYSLKQLCEEDGLPVRQTKSPISIGLPSGIDLETVENCIMHHPAISVKLLEIVPNASEIVTACQDAQIHAERLYTILQILLGKDQGFGVPLRSAVECVIWRTLTKIWHGLSEYDFRLPPKGRRLMLGLDSDEWLENPYLPDFVLAEKYNPLDLHLSQNQDHTIPNMIAPQNMFTNPQFQKYGRWILQRLLKIILLRNNLLYIWIETDFWKAANEDQYSQMGLNKAEYMGRFGPLNYDLPGMDNTVLEDDGFEDTDQKEVTYDVGDAIDTHLHPNSFNWKCGPLAISELDTVQSSFDFSSINSIIRIIRPLNCSFLAKALKIQVLEKNWTMATVEINSFIMFDIHKVAMNEKEPETNLEKSKVRMLQ
ncbi:hypothetical protein HDU84_001139 [Entophlyctis sp. JEL0112]|nr:hypothetical protein HDU84_001139 [Entophlyctis sp. JEL0112]